MSSKGNGASAPRYRSSRHGSDFNLPTVSEKVEVTSEANSAAKRDYEKMVATRHERIALAAYSMAEARSFHTGHDADDWFLAQEDIDARDAGISLV